MKKCKNHILYKWNDKLIYMNNYLEHIFINYHKFKHAAENYKNSKWIYMKEPFDLLSLNDTQLFQYCPECGEKINWLYLKELANEKV